MRHSGASWFTIVPAAIAAAAPAPASATVYMSVEQAAHAMFPGAKMVDKSVTFTDAQRKAIAQASKASVPKTQRVWEARDGNGRAGWFIVDRVLGKHEYITYAAGLTADGAVKQIEILEYRETYGGEVRNANWRKQFVGKRFGSQLKLDGDIRNISGATLSSRHITDGVRRLLATWQLVLRNG